MIKKHFGYASTFNLVRTFDGTCAIEHGITPPIKEKRPCIHV